MKNYMNFKAFRTDMNKAMEELGKKYGVTLSAGNISYDSNTFNIKVEGKRTDVDVAKEKYLEALTYMKYLGFTEDDYQKWFYNNGKMYKIIGFKPGNKYDVIAERSDGNQYCMVSSGVLKAIRKESV